MENTTETTLNFTCNFTIDIRTYYHAKKDSQVLYPNIKYKPKYWSDYDESPLHVMQNITSIDSFPVSEIGIYPLYFTDEWFEIDKIFYIIEVINNSGVSTYKSEKTYLTNKCFKVIDDESTNLFTVDSTYLKENLSSDLSKIDSTSKTVNLIFYVESVKDYYKPYNFTQTIVNCISSSSDTTVSNILPIKYTANEGYVFKALPTLNNAYSTYNNSPTFSISDDSKTLMGNIIPNNKGDVTITVVAQKEEVIVTSPYIKIFVPSNELLSELSTKRWTTFNQSSSGYVDTFSYIRKLYQAYINVDTIGEDEVIIADYYDLGKKCPFTNIQVQVIKSDTIKITPKFNNIYDYEPFSTAKIYLPFVGIQTLELNKIMDKNIYIEYSCNLYTMNCVCRLYADNILVDNFTGSFGVEFPFKCFDNDNTKIESKEYVYDLVPKIIITNKIPYNTDSVKTIDVSDLGKNFNGYIEGDKIYLNESTIKENFSGITTSEIDMISSCIKGGIYI